MKHILMRVEGQIGGGVGSYVTKGGKKGKTTNFTWAWGDIHSRVSGKLTEVWKDKQGVSCRYV